MKLLILDFRERLRCLLNGDERVKSYGQQDQTQEQIVELATAQDEPFVLLWHKPAEEAITLVTGLASHWPAILSGCVFFSSEPYANAGSCLEAILERIPETLEKRVHILSSGVSYAFDPNRSKNDKGLWNRLCRFRDHVLARSGSSPLTFSLLEPELKNSQEDQNELVLRIKYLAAKDARTLRTGRLPVAIGCPACQKRGGVHHELEWLGDEASPAELQELLTGGKGKLLKEAIKDAQTLRDQVIERLCRKIDIRLETSPEWRKIKDHVDEAFKSCKILNPELRQQTEMALGNCFELMRQPAQWQKAKTLALELRRSLDCGDCQYDHKVQL